MARVARDDRGAFEELVTKYQKKVINFVYRYTGNPSVAEELAQESFIRVYRAAGSYRPEARFTTWLFTIVRNICMNYKTREGRHDQQMDPEAASLQLSSSESNPETEALRREMRQKIQAAIQELPETLRAPLVLNHFNQMQYEEIAKILNLSLTAVKVRIHRAKAALAEKLRPLRESDRL